MDNASRRDLTQARAEVERLNTWDGLMSLLDKHYPADIEVLAGQSGGPGPRMVLAVRTIDELKHDLAQANAVRDAIATLTENKQTTISIRDSHDGCIHALVSDRKRDHVWNVREDTLREALAACVAARDEHDKEAK